LLVTIPREHRHHVTFLLSDIPQRSAGFAEAHSPRESLEEGALLTRTVEPWCDRSASAAERDDSEVVERHRSKRLLRHEADEVEDRLAHFDLVRPPVSLLHLEHAGLMLVRT
jgi:hypothetical protein